METKEIEKAPRTFILAKVLARISHHGFLDAVQYITNISPRYWSERSYPTFIEDMVLITFFKDMYAIGYSDLEHYYTLGYHMAHSTYNHNIPLTRKHLKSWAEGKIVVTSLDDWKERASHYKFGEQVKEANLWMDSSDFPIGGKRSIRRKDAYWSYKLNGPGMRYFFICDAHGRVQKIWGPFSPKLYDADFFYASKDSFDPTFAGATVIADNHYAKARNILHHVKFLCNLVKKSITSRVNATEDRENLQFIHLTQQQERYNSAHQKARARIEIPFGLIDRKFDSLKAPWEEDLDNLNYTIHIAVAVANLSLEEI